MSDDAPKVPEAIARLLAEEAAELEHGITYFIQHKGDLAGPIKIGRASSLLHRMRQVRDFPFGIHLMGYMLGDHEKELHHRFAKSRIVVPEFQGREWFHPTKELLEFMANNANLNPATPMAIREVLQAIQKKRRRSSPSTANNGWTEQQIADALAEAQARHDQACTSLVTVEGQGWLANTIAGHMTHFFPFCQEVDPDPETEPCGDCETCWIISGCEVVARVKDLFIAFQIHEPRKEIIAHLHQFIDPEEPNPEFETLWHADADLDNAGWNLLIASHDRQLWRTSRTRFDALDPIGKLPTSWSKIH